MKQMQQKSKVFYFKRWCSKNFAIFASLKRQIVISCIALGCSFLAKPTEGLAQIGSDSLKHHLDEVDVIGDLPPETPLMENALLQISISQKEIERAPIQSVSELLEHFPGVDIRQRGPFGTQADISYRGGNFDQTMLLLNGINFTDPQTGHYNLNLPISFNVIRKVELYNNTSAFLFGSSPFSGLINIITTPESKNSFNTWLSGGMYGYFNGGAAITFKTGNVTHLLTGDYSRSYGYIHNTDFSNGSIFYQNIAEYKTGKLEFQIGYSDKKYGANGFYSLRYPDQYETVKTGFGSILYRYKKKNVDVVPSLYYRVNADCFELIKNQSVLKNNYHLSQIGGANLLTAFYTKGGKTSFSIDARMEDILSTSLGETIKQPVATLLDSVFYNHRRTRLNTGLSASHFYVYKGFQAQLTLLLQYFTDIKKNLYCLPAGFVGYHFQPKQHGNQFLLGNITLSASNAVRTPTFTDLYYNTGDIEGNKNLKPETAYTIELSGIFNLKKDPKNEAYFNVNLSVFNRWGVNMIDYIKKEGEVKWHTVNHTMITFTGVELMSEWLPTHYYRPDFWLKKVAFQYCYLYSNKESKGYLSRYVLDHLSHHFAFILSHAFYKDFGAEYAVTFNKRKGEYTSYRDIATGKPTYYPAYCLLDIRLFYQWKMINFYVEATNILNQRYFDLGDLEQPGISVRAGIKVKFDVEK